MRVAFLGTGIMGAGMARNAVAGGHDVVVWNRTRSRAEDLVEDGARVADTPAEAARGARLLVTMLFDTEATREVVAGDDGPLGVEDGPRVWAQCATVGDGYEELAGLARGAGVTYLDAPVLGTRGPARAGELVQLLAGAPDARSLATPVLSTWSRTVRVTGDEPGSASRTKLAVNAALAAVNGTTAELLVLADRLGVGGATLLEVLDGSPIHSPLMGVKGGMMLAGDLDAHFPLVGLHKDLALAHASAGLDDGELPVLAAVLDRLRVAMDAGLGDRDMAAVHEPYCG